MNPVCDYQSLLERLDARFRYDLSITGKNSLLIGICFARPSSQLAKSDIIPQIPDWHYRSGNSADFFFAGFSDHPRDESSVELDLVVQRRWYYNSRAFNEFRRDIEERTSWQYSGASDLILCVAKWDRRREQAKIDFSLAIACQLDSMKDTKAFASVEQYFEEIFRYAENNHLAPNIVELSDRLGAQRAGQELKRAVLSLLPSQVGSAFDRIAPHAVKNIGNKAR
ncbi:hypothetical protein ABKS89_25060 [Pseudomonas sp. LABIM340]|uniref:hypothetical protein n=1 Tax=Pseudomonas sp. LABIM340 TaxID=3156585 RepID=UPI0032AFF628